MNLWPVTCIIQLLRVCAANAASATGRESCNSAVTGLTDHIESIRREAYTEGYAAAMWAVVPFSTFGTTKPKRAAAKTTATKTRAAEATAAESTGRAAAAETRTS
jgi:hypothetical protein